jgi:hypothetical protein
LEQLGREFINGGMIEEDYEIIHNCVAQASPVTDILKFSRKMSFQFSRFGGKFEEKS